MGREHSPIVFVVPGRPAPFVRATGKEYRIQSNPAIVRYMDYRSTVQDYAALAMRGVNRMKGAVDLHVAVHLKRPHKKRWDGVNVYKAVEDALNKVVFDDDKQVRNGQFTMHEASCRMDVFGEMVDEWVVVSVIPVSEAPWHEGS